MENRFSAWRTARWTEILHGPGMALINFRDSRMFARFKT